MTTQCLPAAADPADPADGSFCQTVRLLEADAPVASARWLAMDHGVAQILQLHVDPDQRRQGVGQRLLQAVAAEVRTHFRAAGVKPRRLWMAVEQKSQVIARAFLTDQGFHHIATVQDLFPGQDMLIYSKALD